MKDKFVWFEVSACINYKKHFVLRHFRADLVDALVAVNSSLHVATHFYTLALLQPFLLFVLHPFIMNVAFFRFFSMVLTTSLKAWTKQDTALTLSSFVEVSLKMSCLFKLTLMLQVAEQRVSSITLLDNQYL